MDESELLERLPELLFDGFRHQLLLGVVPAETVGSVLEPFLMHFWDVVLRLPPDLQADLENILRVYPEVAARFDLRMKPPIEKAMPDLAEFLRDRDRLIPIVDPGAAVLDLAAEDQEELDRPERRILFEGQGFYRTDRGNSVFLEFSFAEGDDFITFGRRPADIAVDIYIRGSLALGLSPGEREKRIDVGRFLEVYGEAEFIGKSIRIVERREDRVEGNT